MRRTWTARSTIFHEGDRADRVLILEQGMAKAVVWSEEGTETILALRGPGEILGELAAVDGGTRSASVVAVEAVCALTLSLDQFHDFLESNPKASLVLLSTIAARVRDASRRQAEFGTFDASVRLARLLVELADAYGTDGQDGLRVRLLSQEELASLCGTSRDSVARALRQLRDAGIIETGRRAVTIGDLEALRVWEP